MTSSAAVAGPAHRLVRRAARFAARLRGETDPVNEDGLPHAWHHRIVAVRDRAAALAGADDGRLRRAAEALRRRAGAGEPLDGLLVETFALTAEAARRTLGLRLYDVQLAAGLALAGPGGGAGPWRPGLRGAVVEMATGEGKTLAAVAPLALHALAGRGVHVLTFNDYLARRDAAWMGPVYALLGLTVGRVQQGMSTAARRTAYRCDVVYLTAKEAGFDVLRDGLCLDPGEQVHRPFHFALVDEADSTLIDEARIPLVIAGDTDEARIDLARLAELARRLEPGADYATDEYAHNVFLTERGIERSEELLGCGNLYAEESAQLAAEVRNALHAEALLHRDVDYIVRGGRVELVDEHTGRVAENRRWPDGLQAAVEAKEGLRLGREGSILGSLSLQHLLDLYPHLSGMTGTARAAGRELGEIYRLGVVAIPHHRPLVRIDHPDAVFVDRAAKQRAVIAEIERVHASGRPMLVGTVSVEESERLAAALAERGIACQVLNAKHDAREAAIVAEAGAPGAVTISTNMAGRGTDIRLGGADQSAAERVRALGGLYVIGTNRHESRRIDDQLRGRAGRQGDPGSSRFLVSLEDPLLARYGLRRLVPDRLLPADHDGEIDLPAVRREIAHVQRVVEGENGDVRRRLRGYSSLVEVQRRELGALRQALLDGSAETEVAGPELLAERCPERWATAGAAVGERRREAIARRLGLLMIDRCWSDHLAELDCTKDELHLVGLEGRTPLVELARRAAAAWEGLLERIDEETVAAFESLSITADGADWEAAGLRAPSATWTYLVSDDLFGNDVLHTLAVRPSIGLIAVIAVWPVLLAWAIYQRWRRRGG